MPRRVLPPALSAPSPPLPPSPLVQALRRDWRWAGISQFVYCFSDAFGLVDWDIEALERDIDGPENESVPDLLVKLLVALTWNRQINRENLFDHLRKQYLKRDPEHNVLGTPEDPRSWQTLGLGQKVQILWQLCEWQMDEPARFRSLLKTEDEAPSWRVDPIGWDKVGNTFYLFDDNRLWIQRARPAPPRPAKKSSLKAKRAQRAQRRAQATTKRSHKKAVPSTKEETSPQKVEESPTVTGPRKRSQVVFYGNVTPTAQAFGRAGVAESQIRSDRLTRNYGSSRARSSGEIPRPSVPLGTRVSRRLRSGADEWQEVPAEWLKSSNGARSNAQRADEEESELSDLTDEEVHEAIVQASLAPEPAVEHMANAIESPLSEPPEPDETEASDDNAPSVAGDDEMAEDDLGVDASDGEIDVEEDEFQRGIQEMKDMPPDFVEWEAVCVTLYDWQTYPEQWAKSKHPDEKALYRILRNDVGPQVIEVLQAKELERLKDEAINNRKRSSRIATRELERAEIQRRDAAEREMQERMERMRKEEHDKARHETEVVEQERAREARLREREERIAAREQAAIERAEAEFRDREKAERRRERRKRRREGEDVEASTDEDANEGDLNTPSADGPAQASWELKCEVCKQQGWNLKDSADVVCCDDCGRWQHVNCHDRLDLAEGRGLRNWDQVDFRCQECASREIAKRRKLDEPSTSPRSQSVLGQSNGAQLGSTTLPAAGQADISSLVVPPSNPALHHEMNGHGLMAQDSHRANQPITTGSYHQLHSIVPLRSTTNQVNEARSCEQDLMSQAYPSTEVVRGHAQAPTSVAQALLPPTPIVPAETPLSHAHALERYELHRDQAV